MISYIFCSRLLTSTRNRDNDNKHSSTAYEINLNDYSCRKSNIRNTSSINVVLFRLFTSWLIVFWWELVYDLLNLEAYLIDPIYRVFKYEALSIRIEHQNSVLKFSKPKFSRVDAKSSQIYNQRANKWQQNMKKLHIYISLIWIYKRYFSWSRNRGAYLFRRSTRYSPSTTIIYIDSVYIEYNLRLINIIENSMCDVAALAMSGA